MDVWVFGLVEEMEEEVLLLAEQRGSFGGPGRILTVEADEEPAFPGIHFGRWYNLRFFAAEGEPEKGECVGVHGGGVYRFAVPLEGAAPETPQVPLETIIDPEFGEENPIEKKIEQEIAKEE
jgi:hypothetical protein